MKTYLAAIKFVARPGVVAALFVFFLITYSLLNYTTLPFSIPSLQAASGGKTILNVLPHYGAAEAYAHIAAYSPQAVEIYHWILWIDVLLLIPLYVAFLSAALLHASGLLFRDRGWKFLNWLAAIPLAAALLNLVEDGIIVYLIDAYPHRYDRAAEICGAVTSTKSLLLTTTLLIVFAIYLLIGFSRVSYSLGLRKCHI